MFKESPAQYEDRILLLQGDLIQKTAGSYPILVKHLRYPRTVRRA